MKIYNTPRKLRLNPPFFIKSIAFGLLFVLAAFNSNAQSIEINTSAYPSGDSTFIIKDTLYLDYFEVGDNGHTKIKGDGLNPSGGKLWDYNPGSAGVGYDTLIVEKSGAYDTLIVRVNPRIDYDTTYSVCADTSDFDIQHAVDTPATISGGSKNITYYDNNSAVVGGRFYPSNVGNLPGTYTIYVTDTVTIDGEHFTDIDSTEVILNDLPTAYDLMKDTSYCASGSGVKLWIEGDDGDHYVLEKNGSPIDTVTGDGVGNVEFPGPYKKGTYTAYAYNTGCQKYMNNSVTVSEITTVSSDIIYYNSDTSFCPGGTGVEIGLDTSMLGVDYELYREGNPIKTVSGTGDSISFGPQTDSTGYYKVEASNGSGSCSPFLDDSIKVYKKETPVAYNLEGDTTVCIGSSSIKFYLPDSDADVTYKLYDKKSPGSPYTTEAGTGDSVFFSVSDTGTYYAVGKHNTTGCRTSMNNEVTLDYHPEFNVNVSKGDTAICPGESTEIAVSNGVKWEWSPSGSLNDTTISSPTASPTSTETYNVIVTNTNGCKDDTSITVTVNGLPNAEAGPDRSICNGDSTLLSAGGYNSSNSYSWNPTGTLAYPDSADTKAGPTTKTTYELTVTDANGCVNKDAVQVTIDSVPAPSVNDETICPGGSATLTATDGDTFSWSPGGETGPSITKSPDDTTSYEVTAEYTNGCSAKATGTIFVREAPTVDVDVDNSFYICSGCDTTITASATDGSSPYDFLWSNGEDTSTVTLSTTIDTSYQVNVTDNKGCMDSTTVNMYVNPSIQVDSNYCVNQDSFQLTVDKGASIPDGEFIVYDPSDTLYSAKEGTSDAVFDPSSQGAGDYGIKYLVSDTTASYEDSVGFTVHPLPDASFTLDGVINTTDDISYCQNRDTVTLEGVNKPGTFDSDTGVGVIGNKLIPEDLVPGDYVITYEYTGSLGCTAIDSAEITIRPITPAEINGLDSEYCMSANEFTISGSPDSGSFSSGWTNTDIFEDLGGGKASFNPSEVNTEGKYTIRYKATAPNGCVDSTRQEVQINTLPAVSITGLTDSSELCSSADTVKLTGHPTDSNGSFISLVGTGITNHNDGTATLDPSEPSPGIYDIVYQYEDTTTSCKNTDTLTVEILESPDTDYNFSGGGFYCEGTDGNKLSMGNSDSGVQYTLFVGQTTPRDTVTPTSDGQFDFDGHYKEGEYSVLAEAPNGCADSIENTQTIYQKESPASADTIHGDDTVSLGGTGSYTTPPIPNSDTTIWILPDNATVTNTTDGGRTIDVSFSSSVSTGYDTIGVYGTNGCGNGGTFYYKIYVQPKPLAVDTIIGETSVCAGSEELNYKIDPDSLGADSIEWHVPSGFSIVSGRGTQSIEAELTDTATSGYVWARGVNASGKGKADSLHVKINPIPVIDNITFSDELDCGVDSVLLVGYSTTPSASFKWTGEGRTVNNDSVYATDTVNYKLTVNAKECRTDTIVTVKGNFAKPSLSFDTPDTITCNNPTEELKVNTSTDSIVWTASSGGNIVSGANTATPVVNTDGDYTVTVTSTDNFCTATDKVTVHKDTSKVKFDIYDPADITCDKDTSVITADNLSDVSYAWNKDGTGDDIIDGRYTHSVTVKDTGTYTLKVTKDNNGCTSVDSAFVGLDDNKPTNINLDKSGDITCDEDQVTLTASTSTSGVTYNFYVPAGYSGSIDSTSGNIAMVSQEGKYAVRITRSSNGCWEEDTIDVANDKNPFSISIAVSAGTITCDEPYDTLKVDDSGLNDKIFQWSASNGGTIKNGITSPTAIVSSAGEYTATVTDTITGCEATDQDTVSADTTAPSIAGVTKNPDSLTCVKDVNLVADVSNYTSLSWSGPGNITPPDQDSVYVDKPGYYTLTATASNGCTSTYNNIKVPADTASPNMVITTNYDDITCSNTHDTLDVSSSTPNVSYQWSKVSGSGNLTSSGTQNPVVDGAGTFRATITADNGCTTDSTVSVDTNYTKPVIDNFDRDPKDISCKNQTVELWGSTSTPDSALLWTTTGIGNIDYETTEHPVVDEPGDYTLTVTNLETGCTVDSTVNVERNDSLPIADVEDNPGQITCMVDTVSIDGSASSGVNFKWTDRNGNILSDDTLEQIYVGSDGWYILTVEHPTSGCTAKDSVYVDKANSVPDIVEGSHSTTTLTCNEDTAILRINSVNVPDYWWSTGNGNIKSGDSTFAAVVDEPGKYTFTAVDSTNGCSNSISVKVDKATKPPKVSLSSGKLTCTTDTVHLNSKVEYATDVDKVSYSWTPGGGGNIVTGDSASPNPRVTEPATYTLTLTDDLNGCTTTEDVTVPENTTEPAIYIDKNPDDITCGDSKVTLEETSNQSDVSYVWSTTGNGNIANKYTPTPTVDSAGWYTLKITDNNTGCFVEDSVEVESDFNQPGISINPDIKDITCSRDSVMLEGGSPDDVYYEWTGAGTITDPNSQLTYVYDGATTYTLTVTDKVNGCTNDSSVTVVENTDTPDAPVLSSSSTCKGSSNVALTATTGTNIKWYSDAGLTNLVGTGSTYTPTDTAAGDHAYHATQTASNGCTSDPSSVIYTIHSLPGEPTAADTSICYGAPNPFMDAHPTNSNYTIKWYNSSDSVLSNSYSYKPKDSAVGTYEYGVSQVDDNGCESSQTSAYFTINDLPSAPVVEEDTLNVCYGSEKSFVANGDNVKWYNTMPPANAIATGNVFTPSESTTGKYSYYVTQSNSSTSCESNYTEVTYNILPNPDKFDLTGGGTYCEGTNGVPIELSGSENTATYELRRDGNTFITGKAGTGDSLSFGNVTSEGIFTAYATSADGCISKMNGTVSVTQDPLPEEPGTIVGDSVVCQGVTVDYSVPEIEYAADYIWSLPEGAEIIAGDNSRTITVSYSDTAESGIIKVYGSNSCGDGPESIGHAIDVNLLPDSAKAITGPDIICQGEDGVAFEVPQIANVNEYVWTLPSGATITSGAGTRQIIVDFSNSFTGGIIKVHGENVCGSGASSPNHTIDVTDKPKIATDLYKSVCSASDSLIVEDPGGSVTVLWELIEGQGTIAKANSFETEVTNLGTGINKFVVTLSNGSCAAMDTVTIENNQLFVNAGADDQLCTDSTRLSGSVPDDGVTGTWTAEQGSANFADANVHNTDITEIAEGKNVFRWTLSKNGCESYDEVTIINNAPTEADAGISVSVCGDSAELNANATGPEEAGTWSINNGFADFENKHDPNTKITEIAKGENTLTWTIEKYDCSSTDQIKITNNKVEVEAGEDQTLCGYRTTLNAEAPTKGDGEWSIISGQASFDNRESPNTEVYLGEADTTVLAWNVFYNGCQSVDSLTLINNSPTKADAGTDQEIFQNSTFLDAAAPSKGDGKWSLLEGSGNFEDDTDPKTKVTDLAYGENRFQWLVTYESCTSIDTVTIDNQTAGSITAGKDTIICSDQIQLNASRPQYGEGEWSVVRGSASFDDPNNPETIARGLSKDTNKLKWTVYGAGVVSDEVIIINNSPTSANTGPDMTYCADSTQLSANSPAVGEGVWSTIGGSGTFDDSTKNNTMVRDLSNGTNTFRWTITHENCKSSDDVVITNDQPTQADAGQDQTLCTDEAVLYGNSPAVGEGLWTLVSGSNSVTFQDQTIGNTVVENLGHGDNVLRWTITNGNCSSSDEVIITNDNPTEPNAGRDKSICVDSFRLNANEITIGESSWKVISGYGEFEDSTQHDTKVRNLAKGNNILRWTAENNNCVLQDEVEISNNLVEADAGFSQSICVDSTSLSANNPAPGTGYWSVVAGSASFDDPNQSDTDVSGLDHQVTNILKWTIANESCVSSDTITIDNNHPGVIYAGQDKEICGSSVTLKANPNYLGEAEWSSLTGGGVIHNSDSASTRVTDLSLGNNTFRWTIRRNGCIYSDEVTIYNNSPVEAYAGENDSTCSNSYTLHGEEPPFGRGKWSVVAGSGEFENDTSYTTTVNNMAQGVNTYKWTLYNGSCSTSDEVTIVVNKPDTPLAGPDKTVCSDSTQLQGNRHNDEQTGYWEVVEGSANFEDKNDPKTKVTGLNYGRNTLRWNIEKNGCLLYDEVTITNNSPTVAFAGDNMHVCGDETSLNAEEPSIGTGEWSLVSGTGTFEDKSSSHTVVSDLSYGPNTFRWTTKHNGCTSFDDVIIYNDQATAYAGEDQETYEPSAYLVGNTPTRGEGQWIILGGSGTFENADSAQTMVWDLSPGVNTFRWKITNNSCIAYDEVSITYYEMPKVDFTVDTNNGCPPLEVQFLNKSLNSTSQFEWDFGDNNISTHENPRHTYYEPGEYKVVLSTVGPDGSVVSEDTTIIVHDIPEADFDVAPNKLYIPEQHLQAYNMSIDADRFLWHFGDDSTSTRESPRHTYQDTGTYDIGLEVWSKYNCYDSIVKPNLVTVEQSGKIKFPSGFTPNPGGPVGGHYNENDRSNDVFHPIVKGVAEYHLEIFNRWGVMVFQSDDIDIGWDGYFKGELAPEGVYIYKVTGRYNNGRAFEKTGDFILIRK